MSCSKWISVLAVAAFLAVPATALAQRGGGGGHASAGGGSHAVGTAVPRGGAPAPGHPIAGPPGSPGYPGGPGHPGGYYPYRPYYPYYPYYRGYYPYYGYGYGYGYPYYWPSFSFSYYYGYPYYAYPYPYYYANPYPYYPAVGAPEPSSDSNSVTATAMGGIRILDVPGEGQVFADGNYAGRVDDFDQPTQQLSLAPGVHRIEIQIQGQPSKLFDVNIQAGQTINYHAR
jgi:hypothetical protein